MWRPDQPLFDARFRLYVEAAVRPQFFRDGMAHRDSTILLRPKYHAAIHKRRYAWQQVADYLRSTSLGTTSQPASKPIASKRRRSCSPHRLPPATPSRLFSAGLAPRHRKGPEELCRPWCSQIDRYLSLLWNRPDQAAPAWRE